MATAFPSGEYETRAACQVLLPHSMKVLSYLSHNREETLYRATVANNTAWHLFLAGEYTAAENLSRNVMLAWEKVLGLKHPDTLTSVSQLGSVLESQGKYKEAEAMHRRALEGREKAL